MGRKKTAVVRSKPEFRPFCYYCDRDFDSEKILIQHQKLKHFQCSRCHRKSDTAQGLVGHMMQVHRDTLMRVPNAIPDRDDPEIVIHGTEGVPRHILMLKAKGTLLEDELIKERLLEQAMMHGNVLPVPAPAGMPHYSLLHMNFSYPPPPLHGINYMTPYISGLPHLIPLLVPGSVPVRSDGSLANADPVQLVNHLGKATPSQVNKSTDS